MMHHIPMDLQALPNWVCWRYVDRPDKRTGEIRRAKMPFQPNGHAARANDHSTWCSFDRAREVTTSYMPEWHIVRSTSFRWELTSATFSAQPPTTPTLIPPLEAPPSLSV